MIEQQIGSKLEWQELPGKKASRIALYRLDTDPADENAFETVHAWMLDKMQRFRSVFAPRVKVLNLDEGDNASDE